MPPTRSSAFSAALAILSACLLFPPSGVAAIHPRFFTPCSMRFMRMLRLDLVYVRLTDPVGGAPVEIVRLAQLRGPMPGARDLRSAQPLFGDDPRKWPPLLRNPMGEGDVSIVALRLGLQGELGVIVAAAGRTYFPRQTETLLLSVAANQAVIGLQEARLLSEQRRVANELDQQVAQRTAELAAANEELKRSLLSADWWKRGSCRRRGI